MRLRELELKDAPLMLEWMYDTSVVEYLQTNFSEKTEEDCIRFITESRKNQDRNLHLAVVDDQDEYQGTVSLKNINSNSAEFAITIRSCAMGKGISREAMAEIIRIAFSRKKLCRVYWCVSPRNERAVRFYDKNGYKRVNPSCLIIRGYNNKQIESYFWYMVDRSDTEL